MKFLNFFKSNENYENTEELDSVKELERKIRGLDEKTQELEREYETKNSAITKFKDELERKDIVIKNLLKEIKSSPIRTISEIEYIGDDDGIGSYLTSVEVYEEVAAYYAYEMYGKKRFSKSELKGNITISLKVSDRYTSKKEIFEAINRAYPKLLEYFRQ